MPVPSRGPGRSIKSGGKPSVKSSGRSPGKSAVSVKTGRMSTKIRAPGTKISLINR